MPSPIHASGVVLPLLAAGAFVVLAWRTHRFDEPGVRWFRVLLAVFALVSATVVAMVLALPAAGVPDVAGAIRLVALLLFILALVPWFLFGLEYTGRVPDVSPAVAVALAAPLLAFVYNMLVRMDAVAVPDVAIVAHFVEIAFLGYAGLLAIGSYQILRTTHRYGHLSLRQGGVLVAAMVLPLFGQRIGVELSEGDATAFALTTELGAAYLGVAALFAVAIYRLDIFESTPAAGNIGERAIARDTDDLIVVTDHRNRIIKLNETAAEAFGVTTTGPHGDDLSELLSFGVEDLERLQTVELQLANGKRKYDPQISELTDQHGRWLGYLVSLRDVTDREVRKQRLEVLNRVLRHNLRNELNVVRGRTTTVLEDLDNPEQEAHLREAVDVVDSLSDLGDKAKAIEELMANLRGSEGPVEPADLPTVVDRVVDGFRERFPDATFETAAVPAVAIAVDPDLLQFALANVVENAVEHADSDAPTVTVGGTVDESADFYPVTLSVSDDGPGIPDHEIEVIRQGHETVLEHGSGLGLWVTTWALTELGGDVDFERRDPTGTTVRMRLPHAPLPESEESSPERVADAES